MYEKKIIDFYLFIFLIFVFAPDPEDWRVVKIAKKKNADIYWDTDERLTVFWIL